MKIPFLNVAAAAFALIAPVISATPAAAAKPEIYMSAFNDLGAGGYDVVAYFTENRPVQGSKSFTTEYAGANWRFSSQQNLDAFTVDPAAYVPQYGGYCAWAVSQGYTASANPTNWSVVGGKLYLNYDDGVQRTWLTDPQGFIQKADANWPSVLSK